MSTKLSDLAEKLEISLKDLKKKIGELGFEISPRARVIDDEVAELVSDELGSGDSGEAVSESTAGDEPEDVADIYDELIAREREREIIKSQRKQTAGRDTSSKSGGDSAEASVTGKVVEIPDMITVKELDRKSVV